MAFTLRTLHGLWPLLSDSWAGSLGTPAPGTGFCCFRSSLSISLPSWTPFLRYKGRGKYVYVYATYTFLINLRKLLTVYGFSKIFLKTRD